MAVRRTATAKPTTNRKTVAKKAAPAPKGQDGNTFLLAEIHKLTISELRELATGLGLKETKLKSGILKELRAEGYIRDMDGSASAPATPAATKPAPVRRTAKPAPVEEESDDLDEEADNEEIEEMVKSFAELIHLGQLDEYIQILDDAVNARIEWQEEETARIAKEKRAAAAAAKKKTTTASKIPAVRRKVDADDEMQAAQRAPKGSASKPAPAAFKGRKGIEVLLTSLKGTEVRAKFNGYKPDTDKGMAGVTLMEDYGIKKSGARIFVKTSQLSNI